MDFNADAIATWLRRADGLRARLILHPHGTPPKTVEVLRDDLQEVEDSVRGRVLARRIVPLDVAEPFVRALEDSAMAALRDAERVLAECTIDGDDLSFEDALVAVERGRMDVETAQGLLSAAHRSFAHHAA
jgi:hypothetical protein